MWKDIEFMATFCNLLSNAVMTYKTCSFPNQPVPILVILLQILANSCWAAYSFNMKDFYLFTTAGVSLCLQLLSFKSLTFKEDVIKLSVSDDELPQYPLKK